MKSIGKYLPYILAGAMFLAGRATNTRPDRDLINKFEGERRALQDSISAVNIKLDSVTQLSDDFKRKMAEDSIASARRLQDNNTAYLKLKRYVDKINLRSASTAELDSLRAGLYPR